MSGHVATSRIAPGSSVREAVRQATGHWWLSLVAGIAWVVISLVVLQFDAASVSTVGVVVGLMFILASVQTFALTAVPGVTRWVSALFGVLFAVSAGICFVDPAGTFAALADTLGFLFLVIGVWWMVRAFLEQPVQPLWWTGLISGVLMTVLAFWTAGQFFVEKAYLLLVFAGIWALMQGVSDITRAFALRRLHNTA